jgi:hypothetical protein
MRKTKEVLRLRFEFALAGTAWFPNSLASSSSSRRPSGNGQPIPAAAARSRNWCSAVYFRGAVATTSQLFLSPLQLCAHRGLFGPLSVIL